MSQSEIRNPQSEIVMYSTPWCGDCHRAKRVMQRHDIAYREVNIDEDDEAAAFVMQVNDGKRRVPTFDIGGTIYGNPPITDLVRLLGVN